MINKRFQSPFSFTIHLHSLIRVSRRDKKKHFEIQITRGYSARGTRCPPNCTPRGSFCQYTAEFHSDRHIRSIALLRRLKRDTVLSGQQGTYSGISCAKQARESTAAQLARRQVHLSPAFTVSFKFPTYQNFSSVSLCFHSSFQLSFTVLVYYRSLIQYLELSVVYQTF